MKPIVALSVFLFLATDFLQAQRRPPFLTGNNINSYVLDYKYFNGNSAITTVILLDEVDDSISYRHIKDDFYRDTAGSVFKLCYATRPMGDNHDTAILYEYYKDISDFIDLKTYRKIDKDFFTNRDTLYFWWSDTDGDNLSQIEGADPKTFVPFKHSYMGGKDSSHVFFRTQLYRYEIINGADPNTIVAHELKPGFIITGKCYFTDKLNVFFGVQKIEGADPNSFKLSNRPDFDASDKYRKYFEGKVVE